MNKIRRIKTLLIGLLIWCAGSVVLWFTLPYKPRAIWTIQERSTFAAFSPNGRILATKIGVDTDSRLINEGPIQLWDVNNGQEIACFPETGMNVRSVLFSEDGKIVVLESLSMNDNERAISIFDVQTNEELAVIHQEVVPFFPFLGQVIHIPPFYHCRLSPDGKTLFFDDPWHSNGDYVKLWDVPTRRVRQALKRWPDAFSPDEKFIVIKSATRDKDANWHYETTVQELLTGRCMIKIPHGEGSYLFSPDGTTLVGYFQDVPMAYGHREVIVWDIARGKELARLDGAMNPTFSRNGKRLAANYVGIEGPGSIKVWDTVTWREVGQTAAPTEGLASIGISGWSRIIGDPTRTIFASRLLHLRVIIPAQFDIGWLTWVLRLLLKALPVMKSRSSRFPEEESCLIWIWGIG